MSERTPQVELLLADEGIAYLGQNLEENHIDVSRESEEISPEKAREQFAEIYERLAMLYESANAMEAQLTQLAKLGGSEYVPATQPAAGSVEASVVSVATESPKPQAPKPHPPKQQAQQPEAQIEEARLAEEVQTLKPVEMGQVIIDSTLTQDHISEKSFSNTGPDNREHRRVSTGVLHAGETYQDTPSAPLTTPDRPTQPEAPKQADGYFEGKKVSVRNTTHSSESGALLLEVIDEDGITNTITEDQLEIRKRPSEQESKKPGTEVELYDSTRSREVEVYKVEEKPEEAKSWFSKAREKFGIHYWSAKFGAAKDFIVDNTYTRLLNIGVSGESMTEAERDEKRDKNQKLIILGAGILGGLVVGSLVTAGIINGEQSADVASNLPADLPRNDSAVREQMRDMLNGGNIGGEGVHLPDGVSPEATLDAYVPNANPNYYVTDGMGGRALFDKLGIGGDQWPAYQEQLRAISPESFYEEPGRELLINNVGWLPVELQEFIDKIKR